MAKQPANLTRIYLDQFDVSGALNSTGMNISQETPVVTTFADAGPRRLAGNYDVTHDDMGFFDGIEDGFDEQLQGLFGDSADHYLTKLVEGFNENVVAYDSVVRLTAKPLSAKIGDAVLLGFNTAGSGGLSRGLTLGAATITAVGNRTGRNQGATTSGQLYRVIFRLLAFTGTNITIKLQESQNDGTPDTYADIAGLTSGALTAPGIVVVTTTAATEAWKRVAVTGTSITSATFLVTAGVVTGA